MPSLKTLFQKRTQEERERNSKERYGSFIAYLESKDDCWNCQRHCRTLLHRYFGEWLSKAQVVASRLCRSLQVWTGNCNQRRKWLNWKHCRWWKEMMNALSNWNFLKVAAVVFEHGQQWTRLYQQGKEEAKRLGCCKQLQKKTWLFAGKGGQYKKPESGIDFLCVCDRCWLVWCTNWASHVFGQNHERAWFVPNHHKSQQNQKREKPLGLLDYIGITKHLQQALGIYTDKDKEKAQYFLNVFVTLTKKFRFWKLRYKRVLNLFTEKQS